MSTKSKCWCSGSNDRYIWNNFGGLNSWHKPQLGLNMSGKCYCQAHSLRCMWSMQRSCYRWSKTASLRRSWHRYVLIAPERNWYWSNWCKCLTGRGITGMSSGITSTWGSCHCRTSPESCIFGICSGYLWRWLTKQKQSSNQMWLIGGGTTKIQECETGSCRQSC